jgi:hypothetical protein
MVTDWVLYLRAVQLIFAIIELGLTAYGRFRPQLHSNPTFLFYLQVCPPFFFLMTNVGIYIVADTINSIFSNASPSQLNFVIFCAIWSILAVAFLIISPRYDPQAQHVGHKFPILGVDVVTAIFWFAGFIAWAVKVGVPHCGSDKLCESAQASVAFGAFLW